MTLQKMMLLLAASVTASLATQLPPTCDSPIYCYGDLLHHVQMNKLYEDSKTFVDKRLLESPDVVVEAFKDVLNRTDGNPPKKDLEEFVNKYFAEGDELQPWTPTDLDPSPAFLANIKDETLRQFGQDINDIWPLLGRKVSEEAFTRPERFSLIPLSNGFVVPGGRFKEIYYWDSYWIIEGLLISGMKDTARGMIENLMELVKKIGHVPNGSRRYYIQRSQPPLLTAMVQLYIKATNDIDFLKNSIASLESEAEFWIKNRVTEVIMKNKKRYSLLRYYAESEGPRPESYWEDYSLAHMLPKNEEQKLYVNLKSGAESGWDFSSRWFIDDKGGNSGNLSNIQTEYIVPVELNAIFAGALKTLGDFRALLGNRFAAAKWWTLAALWRDAINSVLWSPDDGIWFDYDFKNNRHRKYFLPTNFAPLWMKTAVNVRAKAPLVLRYLKKSKALRFPGGVPSSLQHTGEQWDFPNAWPPLESILIGALDNAGTPEAKKLALNLANKWVRSNYAAFNSTGHMFEKYDVREPGGIGSGGEYEVQLGFGWSNGVILELLGKYGDQLTLADDPEEEDDFENSPEVRREDKHSSEEFRARA